MTPRSRSFTLLEVLLVAVLLGLLASLTLRGLLTSAASPTHSLRRIAALDAEARLVARRSGPVSLWIASDDQSEMTVLTLESGTRRHRIELKAAVIIAEGLSQITYDRHGQSVDYTVSIGSSPRALRIAGLTGWSVIDER